MTVLDRQRQNSPNMRDAASDAEQWYVSRNDKEYGPLRFSDLAQFVQQKRLLDDDWVWRAGFASWIAAAGVPGLFTAPDRDEFTRPDRGVAGDSVDSKRKHDFKERAKHQIKDFALMFFYLWIVFGMLVVHESIILSQHQIDFQLHGLALINALVFAKVMLVAEDLHLGRRLNDQPLVYSIIFKSIMFAIALICFHILEHVVIGIWHGRTMAESIAEVGANQLSGIVSIGLIGTVALVPFFILRELSRVIGRDNFWALFFHRRNPSVQQARAQTDPLRARHG
jgi:hypothetical protein